MLDKGNYAQVVNELEYEVNELLISAKERFTLEWPNTRVSNVSFLELILMW